MLDSTGTSPHKRNSQSHSHSAAQGDLLHQYAQQLSRQQLASYALAPAAPAAPAAGPSTASAGRRGPPTPRPTPPRLAGPDPGRKVAIPRLKAPAPAPAVPDPTATQRYRISHACEPCRIRKTKCSGEKPICSHCRLVGISCYYGNNKRDRDKEELSSLRDKVDKYEQLLDRLIPTLSRSWQEQIAQIYQPVSVY
ncbi:uncharacterized protein V1510DRAFT_403911 [Dipodascopsis tothii]|uniref:uncharacterized protein n=1 Tax=Dipodascopsis tothii TaxID=44089 RepID=UPI0034CF10A0